MYSGLDYTNSTGMQYTERSSRTQPPNARDRLGVNRGPRLSMRRADEPQNGETYRRMNMTTTITDFKRDSYDAITNPPAFALDMLIQAEKAGCWETGIETTNQKKKFWAAINTSIYGFDEEQDLVVVQVRKAESHKYGVQVHKNWFLLGHLETGAIFAHSIETPIRSKLAKENAQYCVDYALSKIWNCHIDDLKGIVRQGDVALIPIRRLPATDRGPDIPRRRNPVLPGQDQNGAYQRRTRNDENQSGALPDTTGIPRHCLGFQQIHCRLKPINPRQGRH
jgi:hypothetical protein